MAINKSDLAKRVAVGAVYVAITSLATLLSWYSTVVVMALTAALGCYEFLRMARTAGHHPYIVIGTAAACLIPLASLLPLGLSAAVTGLVVVAIAGIIMLLRYFVHEEDTIVDVALTLFGVLYTGLMLTTFILLRGTLPGIQGGLLAFIVIASVWINDGFAYLGGSAFGKHKLAPKISPKKSWEGLAFGLLGSVLAWMVIPLVLPECGFGFVWAALAGIIVGVVSIIGDLTESHIKRGFGVKDSGDIMPGHGGLLDRSDSLIFASAAAYAMVTVAPYLFNLIGFTL